LIEIEKVLDVLASIKFSDTNMQDDGLIFVKDSYQDEVKLYDQPLALPNMNVPSLKPQEDTGQ
jgi:hypothetical protein